MPKLDNPKLLLFSNTRNRFLAIRDTESIPTQLFSAFVCQVWRRPGKADPACVYNRQHLATGEGKQPLSSCKTRTTAIPRRFRPEGWLQYHFALREFFGYPP
ncbi:hypothetical protein ElyMa_004924200 [Elysia marginata]|uniref:Uncharacterized protein n=1 Tax=Elysia marginata TaxID=1093978 RepID=A0AAV4IZI3_9GAST|nr:hypothetical protein ElyMa_004924200 [Elysia marginata]